MNAFRCLSPLGLLIPLTVTAQPRDFPPIEWVSSYSARPPVLDGKPDGAWETAVPLRVTVRAALGGGAPREVTLRALHTDDSLYVLAQWPDPTASELRDPYIWDAAASRYERPTLADDQFALEFALEGPFEINMLATGVSFATDVWHWKAGRSNLEGWVDDKRHIVSSEPIEGGLPYQLGGRAVVHIARPMDGGTPSYVAIDPPSTRGNEVVPSYVGQRPDGSQADVRGKGIHDGRGWTLEMGRRFDTGHQDDAVLDPAAAIECAVAILDDELYWNYRRSWC